MIIYLFFLYIWYICDTCLIHLFYLLFVCLMLKMNPNQTGSARIWNLPYQTEHLPKLSAALAWSASPKTCEHGSNQRFTTRITFSASSNGLRLPLSVFGLVSMRQGRSHQDVSCQGAWQWRPKNWKSPRVWAPSSPVPGSTSWSPGQTSGWNAVLKEPGTLNITHTHLLYRNTWYILI